MLIPSARSAVLVRLLILTAALGLLGPAVPAVADPRSPTPAEIAAAQEKVREARAAVSGLQARATLAAEAYNEARTVAQKADLRRDIAVGDAQRAQSRYVDAKVLATTAQGEATAAEAAAVAADRASTMAAAQATQSQRALNLIAAGAYRSGGQIGVLAHLMLADDPLELANASNLMNRIGDHQQRVIDEMKVAHAHAVVAQRAAVVTRTAAAAAVTRAATVLGQAAAAKDEAARTSRAAGSSAREAEQLLAKANQARLTAQQLVRQADRQLGRAELSVDAMRKAADAARREARGVESGKPPNDAAATAIHWAFEQIGVPYSWGGGNENGPSRGFAQGANTVGFDCSGLTLFIYHKAGVRLDHYSRSQWDQGPPVSSRADLQPGDLMFFAYDTSNPSTIHHVSIYIGNGKMIEAPYTGEVVRVASVHRSGYIGATRPWAS